MKSLRYIAPAGALIILALALLGAARPGPAVAVGVFAQCTGGDAILFARGSGDDVEILAVFDSASRTVTEVLELNGRIHSVVPSPAGHEFAVSFGERQGKSWRRELVIVRDDGTILRRMMHPDDWYFNELSWSADGERIYFDRNKPGVTEEDTGGMGYTAIGVLNVSSMTAEYFPLQHMAAYLEFARFESRFYVSPCLTENLCDEPIEIFDEHGQSLAKRMGMKGTVFSATGRYYVPRLNEGGSPWEVYDSKTNTPLYAFADSEQQRYVYKDPWNPKDDDLLLIDSSVPGEERPGYRRSVFSVREGHAIQTCPVYDCVWSADGKSLIFFRDSRFIVEPVVH